MKVGVLAVQGGYHAHIQAITLFGHEGFEVRNAKELEEKDMLILPGGESTTMLKLIDSPLEQEINNFVNSGKKVFATCAGLILLASHVEHPDQRSLRQLPVRVSRNAYGRQINSFVTSEIKTHNSLHSLSPKIAGTFIRAPKITQLLNDNIEVLATLDDEPVCVKYKNIIACTFHPELDSKESKPLYDFILS